MLKVVSLYVLNTSKLSVCFISNTIGGAMQEKISAVHEQCRIRTDGQTDGPAYGLTDGRTDGPTDGPTDRPCIVAPEKYDRIVGKGGFFGGENYRLPVPFKRLPDTYSEEIFLGAYRHRDWPEATMSLTCLL